jgi:sulfur-carrier protein
MIRVMLPYHLQTLARVGKEIELVVEQPATLGSVLDALENQYPMLQGTLRDRTTNQRRPFIRLFACGQDLSHEPLSTPLPAAVLSGIEPIRLVGAMAGG